MTAADRLDEIQARADAATTAPWSHCLDELRNRTAVHRIGSSEVNADVAFTYRNRDGRGPGMQDAEFIAHARADVPRLVEALRRVLDRHRPVEVEPSDTICGNCSFQLPNGRYFGKVEEWPCDTVRAVEAALGEVAS